MARSAPHILIIEARFYDEIADALAEGAIAALEAVGATYERIAVPGALEIPATLAMALEAGLFEIDDDDDNGRYDGCVVLGTVIRGETYHFEIVSNETARALMELVVDETIALGNGVLTVENAEQAWSRARVAEGDKGGDAARACLRLIDVRDTFDALSEQGAPSPAKSLS
ncbi:MAG: 6,7-dimethyl-8-ribityllumazine synthase [Pseudomonadota bacterium]